MPFDRCQRDESNGISFCKWSGRVVFQFLIHPCPFQALAAFNVFSQKGNAPLCPLGTVQPSSHPYIPYSYPLCLRLLVWMNVNSLSVIKSVLFESCRFKIIVVNYLYMGHFLYTGSLCPPESAPSFRVMPTCLSQFSYVFPWWPDPCIKEVLKTKITYEY